jgi:hypothetical protein
MTWKVEKVVRGETTAFSLSGRVHADHLDKLKAALGCEPANRSLDLKEVTIVDVDVVRFLGHLEQIGVCLLHCFPYIRAWIDKECGKG